MIKKITLALMLFCMTISCGKKGNPEYEDPEKGRNTKYLQK